MKKILLIFLVFIFSFIGMAKERAPAVLILGTQEWAPYHSLDKGKVVGVGIEAVKCVLNSMKQKYEIHLIPWMRAQVNTERGTYDGFFSASHSKKRDKFAVQSKVFINQDWYFYFLKERFNPKSKSEIKKHLTVGARLNSNVKNWLEVNGYKSVGTFADADRMVSLLQRSRLDSYMENEEVFKYTVKKNGLSMSSFGKIKNISHHLGVYFGKKFLKKYPSFLARFNSHIKGCSRLK